MRRRSGLHQMDRETLSYLKPESDVQIKSVALLANPMIHSTTLYRAAAAHAAGLYDESLAGFQDWDFFLKFGRHGKLTISPNTFWPTGSGRAAAASNRRRPIRPPRCASCGATAALTEAIPGRCRWPGPRTPMRICPPDSAAPPSLPSAA